MWALSACEKELPVEEEFILQEITYEVGEDDYITVGLYPFDSFSIINYTDLPVTSANLSITIYHESVFFEPEGEDVEFSTSDFVGIGVGAFLSQELGGNWNDGFDSAWTYVIGEKQTSPCVISDIPIVDVPPHTTVKRQVSVEKCIAQLTYVAKLCGVDTGKIVYLRGKWQGVIIGKDAQTVVTEESNVSEG
jgi:hypothetical protein